MSQPELYTEQERDSLWLDWADRLAIQEPELAEEIVTSIVEAEGENNGN
jgi:hypothetical protein